MFEVHYAFTCPSCLTRNGGRMDVQADDVVQARDLAHNYVLCSKCEKKLPTRHHFTTSIKEMK